MKVNVYGNGLSAYLAAHAARTLGHQVMIIQDEDWDRTQLWESLYVGTHIPGLTTLPYKLRRKMEGTPEDFDAKAGVLGSELVNLAPDTERTQWAWNPIELLNELREKYDHLVWGNGEEHPSDFDVTAAPADTVCLNNDCDFHSVAFWETSFTRYTGIGQQCIVGSGDPDDWWHTCFNVPGAAGTWYPLEKPPRQGHARREAPSGTTCSCNPTRLRVGAGGTWDAQYRSEMAFYDTLRALVEARV